LDVDAECSPPHPGERQRMAPSSHRDIQSASRIGRLAKQRACSVHHKGRRWIGGESIGHTLLIVAQALLSALFLGLLGLLVAAFLGLRGGEISRHISFGFFSAMLTMLAHSMMMFYLIGKGKAVKDAMAEHHLTGDFHARIATARKPVFSIATLAMAVTIIAAILGASVDTGVLPPIVHAMIAYGAIAANVAAVKIEIDALTVSARVVAEVNQQIGS
jgi:small-conductance mechanosensitive channel